MKMEKNKQRLINRSNKYERKALKERVKELNCLYNLTRIVKDANLSFDKALKKKSSQDTRAIATGMLSSERERYGMKKKMESGVVLHSR